MSNSEQTSPTINAAHNIHKQSETDEENNNFQFLQEIP